MAYPRNPPATDAAVQTPAINQARLRSASTMGISMMSGGIGKNELSTKEIPASQCSARRSAALAMVQS
jgi:hypothetical protein